MSTALIETTLATEAAGKPGLWRSVGRAFRTAAVATGRGTAWLARTGYHRRDLVPAALNGAVGDRLAGGPLAIALSFRRDGRDVTPAALLQELRGGNGHAVVFVHGLMANETLWQEPLGDHEGMGPRLARELGATPLYLRYNSGLRISENGRALSRLLEELVSHNDAHLRRLTLIGHSMGGLVIRSAGHYAGVDGARWPTKLRSVVLLATPNEGSYVEKAAHATARVLDHLTPQTRLLARLINARSAGIKDLRHGSLVDEDWQRPDGDHLTAHQRAAVPPISGVEYHVVAGTLAADNASVWARWFGDGLVVPASARGAHVHAQVFARTSHLALMSRAHVNDHVGRALAGGRALIAAETAAGREPPRVHPGLTSVPGKHV